MRVNIKNKEMRFLFIVWILAVCSGCQPGQTILKGHIENYRGEPVILSCNELDLQDTLKIDASGNFSWVPSGTGSEVYTVSVVGYQPWGIPFYLTPGDREELKLLLLSDKTIEVKYSGDRAAENEYRLAFGKLDDLTIGFDSESGKLSFAAYKAKVDQLEKDMQPLLHRIADPEIKAQFKQKQHLWFQDRRTLYASILSGRLRDDKQAADEDFNAFVKSLDLNDPKECNAYMIREIINWQQAQDPACKLAERKVDYLNRLERLVSNQGMKNKFATEYIKGVISYELGRSLEHEIKRYNEICTDNAMCNQIAEQYKEYLRVYGNLMPGKPAPDFELIDDKGKKCRLSDLKGTYVFVDVWATWCHGCVMEIPYMEKLQEHFANDKRITLISISWDYTQKVWLDYLKKHPATWPQYIVDKENMAVMQKEYRMSWIPRFMLIDPEGRLISIDYERPSNRECVKRRREVTKRV